MASGVSSGLAKVEAAAASAAPKVKLNEVMAKRVDEMVRETIKPLQDQFLKAKLWRTANSSDQTDAVRSAALQRLYQLDPDIVNRLKSRFGELANSVGLYSVTEKPVRVMDRDHLTADDLLELDAPVSYAALQAKRKKEQGS